MALTLNIVEGWESNGTKLADVVNGSPTVVTTPAPEMGGTYVLECNAAGEGVEILTIIAANMFGTVRNQGIRVRFANVATNQIFAIIQDLVPGPVISLRLNSSGYLEVLDTTDTVVGTGTTPILANTWYHIEWSFENIVTGDCALDLDGSPEIIINNENFSGTNARIVLQSETNNTVWFDDYYLISDSGGAVNFIGVRHTIQAYQNTVEDATDQGDALEAGTWADIGETPYNEANVGSYTGDPKTGYTRMDEGTRLGPLEDLIDGNAFGGFWVWVLKRDGGGGTTHYLRYGAFDGSVDQILDDSQLLTTSYKTYARSSTAWTYIPSDSVNGDEYFCQGMKVDGAQNLHCAEMWASFLYRYPVQGNGNGNGPVHRKNLLGLIG